MPTFDALHVPPTALEQGGVEVLRAAIVEGGLHVSLRRAFDDPQAWACSSPTWLVTQRASLQMRPG